MRTNFEKYLLEITQSSNCVELNVIQSLWSGYGKISRYRLEDSKLGAKTVVIKAISLGKTDSAHPRGWNTNLSHQRKLKSYEIETCWYKNWAHKTTAQCTIPKFIGEFSENESQWIVLEDLNENFPIRKQAVDLNEIKTCLKWLAHFHGRFIGEKPVGLWKVGTYWHLATRPEEFEKIQDNELKAKAHRIDALLNQCKFQTILHGDAKLANFCFSADSRRVAAVDFQYTGGGCGMKDVAYFLGSGLSSGECEDHELELLDFYFFNLRDALKSNKTIDFESLEEEWRKMYSIAWADFTRFLLGWMPSHQKVNGYSMRVLEKVLNSLNS